MSLAVIASWHHDDNCSNLAICYQHISRSGFLCHYDKHQVILQRSAIDCKQTSRHNETCQQRDDHLPGLSSHVHLQRDTHCSASLCNTRRNCTHTVHRYRPSKKMISTHPPAQQRQRPSTCATKQQISSPENRSLAHPLPWV